MNKLINKNLIILSLSLLTAFVFSTTVLMPMKASAHTFGRDGKNVQTDDSVDPFQQPTTPSNNVVVTATPVIDSINPSSTYKCSSEKNITIVGKNFIPSSVAKWNGSARMTTYFSSTNLVMQANSADICGLGTYLITVDNGNYNGRLSNGVYFTIKTAQASSQTTTPKSYTPRPKTIIVRTNAISNEINTNENSLTANALFASNGFMPSSLFQWLLLFLMILLIVVLTRTMLVKKEKDKPLKHA